MKRLICILSLLLLYQHCARADDIRVMSFNIRYGTASDGDHHWDRRKEFVAETIAAFDPDLMGTQETLGFQKQFLSNKLSGYTAIGVGRDDGGDAGEMTAVFYKTQRFELIGSGHFWLSETPGVPGSVSWDSSLTRMATWVRLKDRRAETDRPILLINTHLDHRGSIARERSAALIRRMAGVMGQGCDIVLTGDFNAAVASAPYRTLFETTGERVGDSDSPALPTFTDTYKAAMEPIAPAQRKGEATFSGFRAGVFDGARIDWIAVAGNWNITSAAIDRTARDGRAPSDHYPVTAVLRRT